MAGDTDTDELFKTLQKSPEFCNNCLRLVKEEVRPVTWTKLKGGYRSARNASFSPTSITYPKKDRIDRGPDGRARGACQCGAYSVYDQVRPISKETAAEYTDHLCQALKELDVEFDEPTLRRVVRRRSTTPATAMKFDETFAVAVEAALVVKRQQDSTDQMTPIRAAPEA